MIIPVRCMTCGQVLADKYEYYLREKKLLQADSNVKRMIYLDDLKTDTAGATGAILDKLGLTKICCRRHMLGHVDLLDDI